jgi:rfaE bifunctional protein nucleotidyltransferase chain/domain
METNRKISPLNEGLKIITDWKQNGLKVVFTNGCFDILHLGHLDYLEKSRDLADKLVVGLNTDKSVRQLKGPGRPINNEYARARMLAAMSFVDLVIAFNEETPLELIKKVKPDILVKGKDYEVENIVGAEFVIGNGGEVKTIELKKGYSTTDIINKIKKTLT